MKENTAINRAADVAPSPPVYSYTDLPDLQYDIPPFVGEFH